MENIKFKRLEITNFRNITELTVNFNENLTEIQAENGKGKTNILSSILWCLFGKNIYDEKAFVISPIIDGVEKNEINTNVKLIFTNGYVINRSYKNRKTTLQTGYEIDGQETLVNITQRDFENQLKENLVDLETFKSLSNINYLPNLNWKDLKELILSLIGGIKDEEILLLDDFNAIEEQIRLMGIDNTKKALNESEKTLNEGIKRKESEYQTLINTKDKYVVDTEENKELEKRRDEIVKELDGIQKTIESNKEKVENIQVNKSKLQELKRERDVLTSKLVSNNYLIESYTTQYDVVATDTDVLRQQEINGYETKKNMYSNRYHELVNVNSKLFDENKIIKSKGEELKAKEIKIENDTCSSCGQHLPEEMIVKTLDKLRQEQEDELTRLSEIFKNNKLVIESNEKEMQQIDTEVKTLDSLIETAKNKTYESGENERQKQIRVQKEQLELDNEQIVRRLEELKIDIEKQHEHIEFLDKESSSIDINTTPLIAELNSINEKLATTITLNKITEDIEKVDCELKNLRLDKENIKNKLELVAKFNNKKSELLRIKAKSNFQIVDFKTKEFTQDGVEQETFKICIDGVDYKELNTGFKILVAIDLVSGIQKLKGLSIPIIVDNAESVTKDILVNDTQIIVAKAVKDKKELEIK